MTNTHPYPIPCVGVIITNTSGEFLLGKRKGAHGAGEWGLPGGKMDFGESVNEAVLREVREETGLDVELTSLIGTLSGIRKGTWLRVVDIVYEGKIIGGELRDSNEGRCRWVCYEEALENLAFDYIEILEPLLSKDSIGSKVIK